MKLQDIVFGRARKMQKKLAVKQLYCNKVTLKLADGTEDVTNKPFCGMKKRWGYTVYTYWDDPTIQPDYKDFNDKEN